MNIPTEIVAVRDGNNSNKAKVNDDGSFNVVIIPKQTPSTAVAVNVIALDLVDGNYNNPNLNWELIPTGKKMYINYFEATSEDPDKSSLVELWYYPNGENDDTGAERITLPIITSNANWSKPLSYVSPLGDGTAGIMMIRRRLDAVDKFVGGEWRGYYE